MFKIYIKNGAETLTVHLDPVQIALSSAGGISSQVVHFLFRFLLEWWWYHPLKLAMAIQNPQSAQFFDPESESTNQIADSGC